MVSPFQNRGDVIFWIHHSEITSNRLAEICHVLIGRSDHHENDGIRHFKVGDVVIAASHGDKS